MDFVLSIFMPVLHSTLVLLDCIVSVFMALRQTTLVVLEFVMAVLQSMFMSMCMAVLESCSPPDWRN